MCGRFTRLYTWKQLHTLLDLRYPADIEMQPSWNVAPSQTTPVCRLDAEGARELVTMKWGFTPAWSKDGKPGPINARSETVAANGLFRRAFASRRCIVPISGFYEWHTIGGTKQPFYLRLTSLEPMPLAGIWERWGAGPDARDTFAILTTSPNPLVEAIHDRMPVILHPGAVREWLGASDPGAALRMPFPAEIMEMFPVSPRVNSPQNNDASLCERMSPAHG
jgi:putative SOS response-associated peptidase YedK